MKRMLINATNPEELRVAVVDGQKLLNLDVENAAHQQKKGNIYKGRVTRVEASLQAAFVEYGGGRQGFLPIKEIGREYYPEDEQGKTPSPRKVRIQDVVSERQELIVQVDKEERGTKGAALTTLPSLAGRYLVLMPNNPRAGGVSRRIEGEDRKELRDALNSLEVPEGVGVIIRTAGIGKSADQLQRDLNHLLQLWHSILEQAESADAPLLIYQEGNTVIRALRDNFEEDITEILVDNQEVADTARQFMQSIMPECAGRVKYYKDSIPLFSRFQIEHQIDTAYSREVALDGGGSLILDPTEALVSVDINSAKATKGQDLEETALQTNLEAAEELPRQLRLRDVGGLIVIDFIDMKRKRNIQAVEDKLREAVKVDRARIKVGKISRFGLLEMSRQRLRPSLGEATHTACPRCNGQGRIRTIESSALHILRVLEEESLKEQTAYIDARVPVEVASYLLNEKRSGLSVLEERYTVSLTIIPDPNLMTPAYSVERGRAKDLEEGESRSVSYSQITTPEPTANPRSSETQPTADSEAPLSPTVAAPRPEQPESAPATSLSPGGTAAASFWKRLLGALLPESGSDARGPSGDQTAEGPAKGKAGQEDSGKGQSTAQAGSGSGRRSRQSSRGRGRSQSQKAGPGSSDQKPTEKTAAKGGSQSTESPKTESPKGAKGGSGTSTREETDSSAKGEKGKKDSGQGAQAAGSAQGSASQDSASQGKETQESGTQTSGKSQRSRSGSRGRRGGSGGRRRRGGQGQSRNNGANQTEANQSAAGQSTEGPKESGQPEKQTASTGGNEGKSESSAKGQGEAGKSGGAKKSGGGSKSTQSQGTAGSEESNKRISPPKPSVDDIQVPAHTADFFETGDAKASGSSPEASEEDRERKEEEESTSES